MYDLDRFLKRYHLKRGQEEGQGLVEYALLLVLVAIVVIAVLLLLGSTISSIFAQISFQLGGGNPPEYNYAWVGTSSTRFNLQYDNKTDCNVAISPGGLKVKVTDQNGAPVSGLTVGIKITLENGFTKVVTLQTQPPGVLAGQTQVSNPLPIGQDPLCKDPRTATAEIVGTGNTVSAVY